MSASTPRSEKCCISPSAVRDQRSPNPHSLESVLPELSASIDQSVYTTDSPVLICEVVLDGEQILETGASDNPLGPSWSCNLTFTAKDKSVVSIHIIDTTSKCITPDGTLNKGVHVANISVLARDLCCSDGRIRLPVFEGIYTISSSFISVSLTAESHEVLQPAPPELTIPAGVSWQKYFYDYETSNVAWKHCSEWLSSRGYDVCHEWILPDGGFTPPRPRRSTKGAVDPFQPQNDEEFVSQAGGDPKFGNLWFEYGVVRNAYDSNNRLVVLKLVPVGGHSNEIRAMRFLNSPELRPHRANRCLPVLDVLETGIGFDVLVLPHWDRRIASVFEWQVDDYFEKAIQAFEGLAFMHEHRVFHGDISPRNMTSNHLGDWELSPIPYPTITTYNYNLAFFDYELASLFPADTPMRDCTSSKYGGTEGFIAPENYSCKAEPKPYELGPADVHALGATLLDDLQQEQTSTLRRFQWQPQPVEYQGIYAWRVVNELVPSYIRLLQEATVADPSSRPDANEMARRLRVLREAIPSQLRFAPPGGYADYNSLMSCALQARLI